LAAPRTDTRLRDEFLDGETFYMIKEVPILIERWRWHYNHTRPHRSLGYRTRHPRRAAAR
jgi:transposase InsO family protein